MFSDKAYGGKDKALIAAQEFRDQVLSEASTPIAETKL
jgi:hypothetical protein